jgi:acetyl esterase/lipase
MNNKLPKIHPELQPIAKRTPSFTFNWLTIWLIRGMAYLGRTPPTPPDILIENKLIPNLKGQGGVRVRLYKPHASSAPIPVLLWLHGGGYVMGNPEMDDLRCVDYVRQLGIAVVSVDYRYAPQHPFPAGLEDSYTALKWAQEQAPHGRLALGGASAGGGLAAALAQLAHDRQEVQLAGQLLVYPMLDDRTVTRTDLANINHLVWTQKSNRFGWESYLGQPCGAESVPPYAVPARRETLAGLPPAWLGVGTADLFHDEGVAYAERLQTAGVACATEVVAGAFHGFDVLAPQLPLVRAFQQAQMAALKSWLFPLN